MLRTFLSILLVCLVTFGLLINDAEARRFGGGRSFGISRSASSFSRPAPAFGQNYSNSQSPFSRAASPASRWFGPLAGLLTGGLLASLFMSNGIGSGVLSWLLVGGLILVVINLLRNRMQPAPQYRRDHDFQNNFARDAAAQFMRNNTHSNHYADNSRSNHYPVGFDSAAFLRDAKVQFIRLQAAYDQKNLNDIREFTTPEVFAEIQLQLQERGNEINKTNVITLNADLLDVETDSQIVAGTEMQTMVASVRFTGQIQENPNEPAAPVTEIWHFRKEIASPRWLVAGVQQN
jgi:predicted lipid-binding transport protein (Tim44 family)